MQSIHKWRVPLSQNSQWNIGLLQPKQLFPHAHQCFSTFPRHPAEDANSNHIRIDADWSKTWARGGNKDTSAATEPRVKPRIIQLDDANLVDTKSLFRTLSAHQKANADRIRIRALLGRESHKPKHKASDFTVTHVTLDPEQRLAQRDYEGKPRALAYDWEIIGKVPRYLRLPWMKELDSQKVSRDFALKRLNTEIQALNRFLSPTTEEMNSAQTALNDVRNIIQTYTGCHRLDVIGSRASGLATALSDLDLNLVWEASTTAESEQPKKSLTQVWRKLRFQRPANGPIMLTHYLKNARVPIIVGMHGVTGLEFQVQSASSGYGSLELVKGFQAEWPTLQSLFKVLKQALQMRALCKGPSGGITSYPLLNMIVVSLKMHQMSTDRFDAGKQLLQFLDFWSDINFYTTGVTHHPSKYLLERLDEHEEGNPLAAANAVSLITQDPIGAVPVEFDVRKNLIDIHEGQNENDFHMALHDPANPHNDLGRSAYRIKDIQATFISMRHKLKSDMAEWDRDIREKGHAEDRPMALLRSLIEGDYSIHNMMRRRLSPSMQERSE